MKFIQAGMIITLLTLASSVQAAIMLPTGSTLLAENNFVGRITSVDIDPLAGGNLSGGVVVGSFMSGSFALVQETHIPEMYFMSEYTFFGPSDDYNFAIEGGYSSVWGGLAVDSDKIGVDWSNNFNSDGLEDTFLHPGNLGYYGFFDIELENYDTDFISGTGSFGWEGVTITFVLDNPLPVPEPSSLVFLLGSLLMLLRQRRV